VRQCLEHKASIHPANNEDIMYTNPDHLCFDCHYHYSSTVNSASFLIKRLNDLSVFKLHLA